MRPRLARPFALLLLCSSASACDLMAEPDGPHPEDFEWTADVPDAAVPAREVRTPVTDARLRRAVEAVTE